MRRQLSDEVADYLRQAIISGELAPSQPVRAEAIGAALEVSATPVREALQSLRVEGFLELRPRKGFTVTPLAADDIRDLFEAHALLAGELTARAAERAEPADIERLLACHAALVAAAEAGAAEKVDTLNHDFHRDIYTLAKSSRLHWGLGAFSKYVPRAFYREIEGWSATTVRDHSVVMDALVAGDAEAARQAMATHIRNAGEKLAEHFETLRTRPASLRADDPLRRGPVSMVSA